MDIDPAEHIGLAHRAIRCMGIPKGHRDYDDMLQDGLVGIVRAAKTYDHARGKWSTYAVTAARNEINRVRGPEYRRRIRGTARVVFRDIDRLEMKAPHLFSDGQDFDAAEVLDVRELLARHATPRMAKAAELLLRRGMSLQEAAREMGCSSQNVGKLMKRLSQIVRDRVLLKCA